MREELGLQSDAAHTRANNFICSFDPMFGANHLSSLNICLIYLKHSASFDLQLEAFEVTEKHLHEGSQNY